MSFDVIKFIKTEAPRSFFLNWFAALLLAVYFALGWLTFTLFVLSLVVKSFERGSDRLLIEVANAVIPYVFPLGLLLLGALASASLASAVLFRGIWGGLLMRNSEGVLYAAFGTNLFFAIGLIGAANWFTSAARFAYAGTGYGIFWVLFVLFFLFYAPLRRRSASFIRTAASLLEEGGSLVPPALSAIALNSFLVASAIGNLFTLLGLLLLPILWLFPNLDFLFGGFLDAHPFVSYLAVVSWGEFVAVLLLIPFAYGWFFFANVCAGSWIRAMLSAAAYEWYRGEEPNFFDPWWVARGRFHFLVRSSLGFFSSAAYEGMIFLIPAIVIQKLSPEEAGLNSRRIAARHIPVSSLPSLSFYGVEPFLFSFAAVSATGLSFLCAVMFPLSFAFFMLIALGFLFLVFSPAIFLLLAAAAYQKTFIYGAYLDEEFPEERAARLPAAVEAHLYEFHKAALAGIAGGAKEDETGAGIVPPEQ